MRLRPTELTVVEYLVKKSLSVAIAARSRAARKSSCAYRDHRDPNVRSIRRAIFETGIAGDRVTASARFIKALGDPVLIPPGRGADIGQDLPARGAWSKFNLA